MALRVNFTVKDGWFVGEDKYLEYHLSKDDHTPQDVTNWTITFKLASSQTSAALFTRTATLTTPLAGIVTVPIVRADTVNLNSAITYWHELARTDSGNNVVLAEGTAALQGRPT